MSITTRAAIARAPHVGWELTDLQLDEPKEHEVRVIGPQVPRDFACRFRFIKTRFFKADSERFYRPA